MSNTYQAKTKAGEAAFAVGVFEHDFTVSDERDWLDSGLLELVPRPYKVLSDNYGAGAQGEQVELALPVEIEAALISGGHIERVEPAKKAVKAVKGEKE